MMLNDFTPDELREINDALAEAVERMLAKQTRQEREYASLSTAWEAQKKVVAKLLPGNPPEWVQIRDAEVKAKASI